MTTFAQLRKYALALPGATEVMFRGEPWLVVGRKTFALRSQKTKAILKLDREHQTMLFEVRPEMFTPCPVGTGGVWSTVDIAQLAPKEVKALVTEAWTQVVPKKVSRAFRGEGT
ncbi:MAG: MmcQ/YjbR family DNA-binding protein [Rhizomicrobium sp.]